MLVLSSKYNIEQVEALRWNGIAWNSWKDKKIFKYECFNIANL